MNYDNDIILTCNGNVVNDIKVTEILSDPANELFDDSFTYVATTHSAYTSYARTNDTDENAWIYDYSAITGAKDWTNTVKLSVNPHECQTNIVLGTELLNYSAVGGHDTRWLNRKDSNFAFRALSFNPNNYYLKVAGLIAGSKTNANSHFSVSLSDYNDDTSFVCSVVISLCDKNGNDVLYNGYPLIVTPLTQIHDKQHDFNYFMSGYYFNDVQTGGNQRIWSSTGETSAYEFTFRYTTKAFGQNITNGNGLVYFPKELSEIEYTRRQTNKYVETDNYSSYQKFYTGASVGNGCIITIGFNLETAKQIVASTGLYFYWGGTLHMPIVSGSVTDGSYVTGSDIDKTHSDIKNYKETQGHTPIYPDHKDDDIELPMTVGNIYSASGLVKYYLLSNSSKLEDISQAMSDADIVPTGKDLLPNLVSLKRFCVDKSLLARGINKTIKIAGVELKDETKGINATGETLDSTQAGIDLGTITINGKYGSESSPHYLDFAPYTELQLYLPLCGWVDLPSKCMYKTLSIFYVFDCCTGSCIATVKSSETIVATATGSLGVDIPFTATSAGIQFAGKLNGLLNGTGALMTGVAGIATGNPITIGASILSGVSAITNGITTANKNYTQVTGRTGDISEWGLMNAPYLKISRPILNTPSNFPHVIGHLYCKQATLNELSGFTTVENPDLELECTEQELNEIKNLLQQGIII